MSDGGDYAKTKKRQNHHSIDLGRRMIAMGYETKMMDRDEALGFLRNMRWFADIGRIRVRPLGNGRYAVQARRAAWSYWNTI
jgi:hypothetical protein